MRDDTNFSKDADSDIQSPDVEPHTGWLKKLGGKFKTWRKRFFVIQGRRMSYYTNPEELRLLGEFSIENVQIDIPDSTDNEFGGESKGYIFILKPAVTSETLSPGHQQMVLAAATPRERKTWIRAIRKALYLKQGGALFGSKLEEVFPYTRPEHDYLPRVVYESAAFIREYGMTTEGIFRKCGTQNQIQALAEAYDVSTPGPILHPEEHSVHIAAGLLKLYLRELPEPVIPFAFYDRLKSVGFKVQLGQDQEMVTDSIEMLPAPNYHLLQFLCQFLNEVAEHHEVNLMTVENLASIFAPNILRQEDGDLDVEISAAPLINLTCTQFIRYHKQLFRLCIAPSSQFDNTLFGSTRQRHHSNSRRRQPIIPGKTQMQSSSVDSDRDNPTTGLDSCRSVGLNQATPLTECQVDIRTNLNASPIDSQPHESPSRSSGIGRSVSSRATRNGLSVTQTESVGTVSGDSLGRRPQRNMTIDQYDLGTHRSRSVYQEPCYAETYPMRSFDRQLGSDVPQAISGNIAMTMMPTQRSASRIPKRSLFCYPSHRHLETLRTGLRTAKSDIGTASFTWSYPENTKMGVNLYRSSPHSEGRFNNIPQLDDQDETPPKPPPFNMTFDSPDASRYFTNNTDKRQERVRTRRQVHPGFGDAAGSWGSSINENVVAGQLEPEEQIRYWRALAVQARAEAAGYRARAHSLVSELGRVRCDLNMAELEIGLLRRRLADTEAMQLSRSHHAGDLIGNWPVYS
ncbi:Rho GTPase-activating protein 22 [Clonorchis sinensis]|uniref:Rho GTPase-activating protein 22 n=1 Tax=Clonorchis sinensis TaxID=79923 RepID=A0A8T1M500_CLOSI|nr:Rho GTPase-activating protein 22 [Clonorchis sinensis]